MRENNKKYNIYSSGNIYKKHLDECDFGFSEKMSLFILAISFILPLVWFSGVFYSYEISMFLCICISHIDIGKYLNVIPLIVILFIPICFEYLFPMGGISYDMKISLVVFIKLSMFVLFLQTFSVRCRNYKNAIWILRFMVMPVAIILAASALVDRYTSSTFFVNWHVFWNTSGQINDALKSGIDGIDIDSARSRGFATRNTDIVSWSLLGLSSSYLLMKINHLKAKSFVIILLFFTLSAFSMPQRGALVSFGVTFIVLILINRTNIDRMWANRILLLSIIMVIMSSSLAFYYDTGLLSSNINIADLEGRSALSRALNFGIVEDTRYEMLVAQLNDFSRNYRLLVIGSGWNFAAGVWSKPHNTYLAIIIGGGIISLIVMIFSVFRLIYRISGALTSSSMGIALTIGITLDMFDNGMMYSVLEYPAGLLIISILVIILIYIVDECLSVQHFA